MITKIDIERFGLFSNYYWKQHILYTHGLGFSDWSGSGSSLLPDLGTLEKPRDFDPFGHAGLSPLVTI